MIKETFVCLFATLVLQIVCNTAIAQNAAGTKDSILYFQPFDTKNAGPSINHGDTAICGVENGNFIMDIKRSNRFWTLHFDTSQIPQQPDILEIKLKMAADSLPGVYGFSWNAALGDNGVWNDFIFLLSTDKQFCIFATKPNGNTPISGWQPSFYVNSTGYNILRIEKKAGNLYQFYINKELVFQTKLQPVTLQFGGLYTDPHSILYVDFVKLAVFR